MIDGSPGRVQDRDIELFLFEGGNLSGQELRFHFSNFCSYFMERRLSENLKFQRIPLI